MSSAGSTPPQRAGLRSASRTSARPSSDASSCVSRPTARSASSSSARRSSRPARAPARRMAARSRRNRTGRRRPPRRTRRRLPTHRPARPRRPPAPTSPSRAASGGFRREDSAQHAWRASRTRRIGTTPAPRLPVPIVHIRGADAWCSSSPFRGRVERCCSAMGPGWSSMIGRWARRRRAERRGRGPGDRCAGRCCVPTEGNSLLPLPGRSAQPPWRRKRVMRSSPMRSRLAGSSMPRPSWGARHRMPILPSCSLRWILRAASPVWVRG